MSLRNECKYFGRLTKDPEVKEVNGKSLARFTIAVDRGKDKDGNDLGADFIPCMAWGHLANNVVKWSGKGLRLSFLGHVRTGSYEKDGKTIYTTDFIADEIQFVDFKPKEGSDSDKGAAAPAAPAASGAPEGSEGECW